MENNSYKFNYFRIQGKKILTELKTGKKVRKHGQAMFVKI